MRVINPPLFHYGAALVDPPWEFKNWSEKGEGRNPNRHYETMPLEEILAIPVGHYVGQDGYIFLWVPKWMIFKAEMALQHWGCHSVTLAFVWAKRTKRDKGWHMGTGYGTRANAEFVFQGAVGNPRRKSKAVRELIVAPIREHSRKPDETRARIEALADGPYLEMFSRSSRPGWDHWGKEVGKFDGEEAQKAKEPCPDRRAQGAAPAARHHGAA